MNKVILAGGHADIEDVADILAISDGDMSYTLYETLTQALQFKSCTLDVVLEEANEILRLHRFGKKGDLVIRVDEQTVIWRYVGQPVEFIVPPRAEIDLTNYDTEDLQTLLWGEYDPERRYWYDNRVGAATEDVLSYPDAPLAERVQVKGTAFRDPRDDSLTAVWTQHIIEWSTT